VLADDAVLPDEPGEHAHVAPAARAVHVAERDGLAVVLELHAAVVVELLASHQELLGHLDSPHLHLAPLFALVGDVLAGDHDLFGFVGVSVHKDVSRVEFEPFGVL